MMVRSASKRCRSSPAANTKGRSRLRLDAAQIDRAVYSFPLLTAPREEDVGTPNGRQADSALKKAQPGGQLELPRPQPPMIIPPGGSMHHRELPLVAE